MTPYTELPSFENVVLEESFVLAICAQPGMVVFKVEFALTPRHFAYRPPGPNARECFRAGQLRFAHVRKLTWMGQGSPPAIDAAGKTDYGHIDFFVASADTYRLGGDWGEMEVSSVRPTLHIES